MERLWGIDLGGTKMEGVVLDKSDDYRVIERMRIPTEADKGYDHIIGQVGKLIGQLQDKTGLRPERLGIGTPGVTDPDTGKMKNANTTCLNGQHFHRDLEKALGIPVRMANDANCFAVAEATMGACKHLDRSPEVVFGVIMGTGVGGGVVINGKVHNGRQGIAGEWGHNFLDNSGGPCYCGRIGCVETNISGPALQRYYHSISGLEKKLPEIVEEYRNGGAEASGTMERLFELFGKSIASVINILDPDVIVLGGGVCNIGELYTHGVEAARKHVFNDRLDTLFLAPKLGDSAGVFGAALL